jgi:hypothetical protein
LHDHNPPPFFGATDCEKDSASPPQNAHERQNSGPSDTNAELFAAWEARGPAEHARQLAQLDAERRAEAERSSRSKAKLAGLLAAAAGRFGGAEVIEPPLLPDPAAARQRKAVLQAPPGRVTVAELAASLNEHTDARIAEHVARAREHVADEDAADAKPNALALLAPHRRERPSSKHDTPRTHIHREARVMAAAIVNSRGAFVIQAYLYKLRSIFSGQPLAALRAAALQPIGPYCRYTYADEGARRRIATGLMWLVCGKWTSQRAAFGSRSTRRGLVIAGMSVDRILRAVTPVGRKPYDRHTFSSRTGWLGDMAHFERAGFAIRKRLPAARCNAWEVGPSGQSKNRYWIGCVVSSREPKRERRNRRGSMTCFADALASVVLDPSAHSVGWDWADERPEYAPRAGAPPPF